MRLNSDGTPLKASPFDEQREERARPILEAAWGCELRHFGRLSPIDWYALRDNRLAAVLEIKGRAHNHDAFTVDYVEAEKWLALQLAGAGMQVPSIVVFQYANDRIYYMETDAIQQGPLVLWGRNNGQKKPCFQIERKLLKEVAHEKVTRPVPEGEHLAHQQDREGWISEHEDRAQHPNPRSAAR